jgi:hypothetical protein
MFLRTVQAPQGRTYLRLVENFRQDGKVKQPLRLRIRTVTDSHPSRFHGNDRSSLEIFSMAGQNPDTDGPCSDDRKLTSRMMP